MIYLFLIIGTLAAFSGGDKKPASVNYSLAAITIACYALATVIRLHGGQ